jgi:FAD/FMN-containing dehydrogenase
MAPFWANRSCDVFGNRDDQCVKGTYIQYAVRVEEVSDVVKTMAFAKSKNIRLVIRNTGHDYLGKSTGAGALGLWMHHLKGFEVSDYKSKQYTGKAVTLGAGMMSQDATAKAHDQGLTIVGGNCPSVGLAGGYTQGGGIGPLTSRYGFGADQVLSWKVVTVDGKILDATPEKNSDLYWALSGGGGGTYGVVVSMTVKAHPEQRTASANLTFGSSGVTEDQFYGAIGDFHEILPKLSSSGGVAIYIIQSTGFSLIPAMLPGATQKELDLFFQPFLKKLQGMNITYSKYVFHPIDLYTNRHQPIHLWMYHPITKPTNL